MSLEDQIYSWPNLVAAWKEVRRKRSAPGVDGMPVDGFALRAEERLSKLQSLLASGTYAPSPLRRVLIPKTDGGHREVAIPTVADRIAQRACLNVLDPLLDRELEECCFAFRRGRSVAQAVARLERFRRDGLTHVVRLDIDECFDSLLHSVMMDTLDDHVEDEQVLELVQRWITAPRTPRPHGLRPGEGIPQGSVVSPFLCNLYLDAFDEAMLADGFSMIRYADDMIIAARAPKQASRALSLATERLADLGLKPDPEKTLITSFDQGFSFLGTLFVRSLVLPRFRVERPGRPPIYVSGYEPPRPRGPRLRRRTERTWGIEVPPDVHTDVADIVEEALSAAGRPTTRFARALAAAFKESRRPSRKSESNQGRSVVELL